ncbi:MAG TPA: hypothetical protein VMW41_02580 [Candidatus Bathyarchaeia archaeon]|nr:hypothetical protein [Candidatus Bathyarchaeia archaeon]
MTEQQELTGDMPAVAVARNKLAQLELGQPEIFQRWQSWINRGREELIRERLCAGPVSSYLQTEDRNQVLAIGDFLSAVGREYWPHFFTLAETALADNLSSDLRLSPQAHLELYLNFVTGMTLDSMKASLGVSDAAMTDAKNRVARQTAVLLESLHAGQIKEEGRKAQAVIWQEWCDDHHELARDVQEIDSLADSQDMTNIHPADRPVVTFLQQIPRQNWPWLLVEVGKREANSCRLSSKLAPADTFAMVEATLHHLVQDQATVIAGERRSGQQLHSWRRRILSHLKGIAQDQALVQTLSGQEMLVPGLVIPEWDPMGQVLTWLGRQRIVLSDGAEPSALFSLLAGVDRSVVQRRIPLSKNSLAVLRKVCQGTALALEAGDLAKLGELRRSLERAGLDGLLKHQVVARNNRQLGVYSLRLLSDRQRLNLEMARQV